MRFSKSVYILVALGIIFGFGGGILGGQFILSTWEPLQDGGTVVREEHTYLETSELIFSVSDVMPAVVSIQTRNSGGTGFVVTTSGLVLTSKHVVADGKTSYKVLFDNGTEYDATVISRDPFDDIAVLQIEKAATDTDVDVDTALFPVLKLGNSDDLKIGQAVFAVGNALSTFSHTVTSGIISALGRSVTAYNETGTTVENLAGLLQTDTAINLGSSGGPLLNMRGEVIGMNVAVVEDGKGLGFAIPVNDLKPAIASIEKYGEIIRPVLGVSFIMLNLEQAQEISEELTSGAILREITGSAAKTAGLKINDVIVKVNEISVTIDQPLHKIIREFAPEETVLVQIYRDGNFINKDVVLKSSKDL